uniref:Uncharacterized protein n=1 Tax=Nelumbo nucifera TaxID=4432 RepID=A0A822YIP2_NELNU|nr:TPA_asm: hypothetical protein HUJ06_009637 [Nelumbo nucifera]
MIPVDSLKEKENRSIYREEQSDQEHLIPLSTMIKFFFMI